MVVVAMGVWGGVGQGQAENAAQIGGWKGLGRRGSRGIERGEVHAES